MPSGSTDGRWSRPRPDRPTTLSSTSAARRQLCRDSSPHAHPRPRRAAGRDGWRCRGRRALPRVHPAGRRPKPYRGHGHRAAGRCRADRPRSTIGQPDRRRCHREHGHSESIEDYTIDLGRSWGVGRQREDSGILLVIANGDRKLRIEVGRGLEGED
ncbi:TPM domain-containing protein [Iamia sp. SCSIO 61187]|uniref:TPM domain-containing protein n=1 Tax=Iamia sp. SCSIO 61187 TaxID=2722752 RepID=UPI001C62542B|nr:TPM domain-containing protein [Iamia sp. SCSIO 61187]